MRPTEKPIVASCDEVLFTEGIQHLMFDERNSNERQLFGDSKPIGQAEIKLEDFKIMKWCDLYPNEEIFPHPLQKYKNARKWNGHECGMFCLHYIRCLVFRIPFKFELRNMKLLRDKMCSEILSLGMETVEKSLSSYADHGSSPLSALTNDDELKSKAASANHVPKPIERKFLSMTAIIPSSATASGNGGNAGNDGGDVNKGCRRKFVVR